MADEKWDTGIDYDDRASGRGGGFRAALRKLLWIGDNFDAWGFTIFRIWGIRVRVHFTLVILIGMFLIKAAISQNQSAVMFVTPMLVWLFVLILLHEFGHCIACRRVGGDADEVMLWPLGGLALCRIPENWRASLITTLGGPAVNAALLPLLGLGVFALTRDWAAVFFNPFNPSLELGGSVSRSPLAHWVWAAHYINALLFMFNMLLPMFPMDAGRVVHALLWRKMGHDKALYLATSVGLGAAVILGLLAVPTDEILLLLIAGFGGITCYNERKRLRLLATGWDGDPYVPAGFETDAPPDPELARIEREAATQADVDRILAKISSKGMGSLTGKERRTLKQASQRSRKP